MISHQEIVHARQAVLRQTVSFFAAQPDVLGIFLAGSLAAGSADAYSDIDLRIIATPEAQQRLLAGRLEWPTHWGDLLFNEWLDGTQHCVSHFRPFVKMDVFYWTPGLFTPSPWFKQPTEVFLDRTGVVRSVLAQSMSLTSGSPSTAEVSRVLSKALAGTHEVVRRVRRGELFYAQSLLDELRGNMTKLDAWTHGVEPPGPQDPKLGGRLSPAMTRAVQQSYSRLDAADIEQANVALSTALSEQIRELHRRYDLERSLTSDLHAVALVVERQVA